MPDTAGPFSFQFEAIGTHWTVAIYQPLPKPAADNLLHDIRSIIEDFDRNYSRFRDDSLINRISREAGSYQLPDDAQPMLDLYEQLYHLTDGAVTPLIGQMLSDAGYDAGYSLKPKTRLTKPPAWEEVLDYRFPELVVRHPALLDFGAAGKGYLVDLVCETLRQHTITRFAVDAGGDIRQQGLHGGDDRIGLEDPKDPGRVIGIASIGDRSLCGSAGNRRSWGSGQASDGGDFHHILDPRSQVPVRGIAGLWVVADQALIADAVATALSFVPATRLADTFQFEYLILYDASKSHAGPAIDHSPNFPAELFLAYN